MALRFVHSDSKQAHLPWRDKDRRWTGVDGYESYNPHESCVWYIMCLARGRYY